MTERPHNLDWLTLHAYHLGTPPMQWAEQQIINLIDIHTRVAADRAENPATWPGYCIEMSTAALARRIIGWLLDGGWTCPNAEEVLQDFQPPGELEPSIQAALIAARDLFDSLPDGGDAATRQARAECGLGASVIDITLRAAEIAREQTS